VAAATQIAGPAGANARPSASGNRRSRGRRPYRVPCRVLFADPVTGRRTALIGQTVNLSAGGMAIRIPREVPPGTWVEAFLTHAFGAPTLHEGRVVECRRILAVGYEIGVEILESDSGDEC
jgi:hypothetical protein